MIEFAKLHVKACTEAIANLDFDNIPNIPEANDHEEAMMIFISNAYPDKFKYNNYESL